MTGILSISWLAGTFWFDNDADDLIDRVTGQMYNQEVCTKHCILSTEKNPRELKVIMVS